MKRSKVLVSFVSVLFTCVLLALSLTACSSGDGKHTHTPDEAVKENVVTATCKEAGSYDEVIYCTVCKKELSRTKIKTAERLSVHNVQNGICTVCGAKESTAGLKFSLNSDGKGYTVTGISSWTASDIVIDLYNGKPVTSIGEEAFRNCKSLTSVTIGTGVTSIGNSAFSYCTSLTSVTIPNSVTSIGNLAFYGCTALIYNEYDNAYYLGNENNKYVALIEAKSTDITSCTINENCKFIYRYAFQNCTSLKSVTIPDSVTSIGYHAFLGCIGLKGVYISDIAKWCGISFYDSYSNPLCYAHNLYLNGELVTDLVIPDGVTSIGFSAFYECTSLTSVTIPDSVTSIGSYAFYYCTSLTSITIPDSVVSIGYDAFSGCTGLTSVYYKGTASEWSNVSIGYYNSYLKNATRYYYSETAPTKTGNYWHYGENGEIVVWGE